MPTSNKPTPPPEIAADAGALAEWDRVCSELEKAGQLAEEHRAILTVYVREWMVWQAAAAHVARHGAIIKWPNGIPGPSPFRKTMRESATVLRGLLADMNLTPASRKPVPKPEGKDLEF